MADSHEPRPLIHRMACGVTQDIDADRLPFASPPTTPTDMDRPASAAIAVSLRDGIADRFIDTASPDVIRNRVAEPYGMGPAGRSSRTLTSSFNKHSVNRLMVEQTERLAEVVCVERARFV